MRIGKLSIYLAALLTFTGIPAAMACSGGQSLFGPKKYARTTGAPDIYRDCFTSADSGDAILVIRNGYKNGKHRVTSALVFLNGTQVLAPKDFKQDRYLMQVPVDLKKKNCILLELRSKPGTFLTLEVIQKQMDAPSVSLEADPEIIPAGISSNLTWTSSHANSCTIEPGIGSVALNGSISVSPAQTTTYTITATGSGKIATDQATVTVVENQPPSIMVIRPHEEGEDPVDCGFTIQWTDQDEDDNAVISLYYDADAQGLDGVLIAGGLSEDPDEDGDRYYWDTTDVPDGQYFVYAVIDDGIHGPVSDYSETPVRISHAFADEVKIIPDDASAQDEIGKSVSVSGDYAIVGAEGNDGEASDAGTAFIFKRECNTWVEKTQLVAADADEWDHFGSAASISGEYALVGAYLCDAGGTDSGAAYIFKRDGEQWVQQARLLASDAASNDHFGFAVSINGDRAIVGAYPKNQGKGAVYVFKREAETWTEQAELTAEGSFNFGWSVHTANSHIVVGAPSDSADGAGSAYIYRFEGDTWVVDAVLSEISPGFGYSVAIGDGLALVGAPRCDGQYDGSGQAHLYKRESSSWVRQTDLSANESTSKPLFGISVGLDEDRAAVGAYDVTGGTAYVYEIEDGDWRHRYTLSDHISERTRHGSSMGISGRHLIVGAYGDDEADAGAGAAYIYDLENYSKKPQIGLMESRDGDDPLNCSLLLRWADADANDNATISLYYDTDARGEDGVMIAEGLSEDPDGTQNTYQWDTTNVEKGTGYVYAVISDGKNTTSAYAKQPVHIHSLFGSQLMVPNDPDLVFSGSFSALSENHALVGIIDANSRNAVMVMKRTLHQWEEDTVLVSPSGSASDGFGCAGDVDGDYAVIGAAADDEQTADGGAAYIFRHRDGAWTLQAKLVADDASAYACFGNSVSISGNLVIIGAIRDSKNGYDAGAAYVFKRIGGAWQQQARLNGTDVAHWANFGACVGLLDDYAFVSANGVNYAGAVYVFRQTDGTWIQHQKLTASDTVPAGYFGNSISVSNDYAVFGSRRGNNSPGAYIFRQADGQWVETTKLVPPDSSEWRDFGSSASLSGKQVVVCGIGEDSGTGFTYGACVFERNQEDWVLVAKLEMADEQLYRHGTFSSINNDSAIMTILGYEDNRVYSFTLSPGHISSEQTTVSIGESATLSWRFPNASSVIIDNGVGEVSSEGSTTVTANEPAVYTATAHGCWGTVVSSAAVAIEEPTIILNAAPETINLGESAALSWNSTDAIACVIEPGIGAVDVNGSLSVSPSENTTYTITATGPGGTASATATIAIAAPRATLTAGPSTILIGNASTLTWSSFNAISCVIQPGIGSVDPSGSTTVSPSETTTYILTATGPGGTATANATIAVLHLPTVSINAEPHAIHIGESATLTWAAQHADSCVIDQGIGSVSPNGSVSVSPSQTTTYSIAASGPGGEVAGSAMVNVIPLATSITSPVDCDNLARDNVMVRGTIINPSGLEVGVTVNGVPAMVQGNEFVANHVPLEAEQNTLTATATDETGNSAIDAVTVSTTPDEHYIRLIADPDSGVAPLETTLTVDGSFTFTPQQPEYTGPGVVEFLESNEENTFNVRIQTTGIYFFSIETTFEGKTYHDMIAVNVLSKEELDLLLKAKWDEMKQALIDGDIEKALSCHQAAMHDKFLAIYTALGDDLPALAQQMKGVSPVFFTDNLVKYRTTQDHEINGETVTITYYVYFSKDEHGIWHIENY